jgi:hypothetical protein
MQKDRRSDVAQAKDFTVMPVFDQPNGNVDTSNECWRRISA